MPGLTASQSVEPGVRGGQGRVVVSRPFWRSLRTPLASPEAPALASTELKNVGKHTELET